MMNFIAKMGGRKLALGLLVIAIGVALQATMGLTEQLLTLLIFVASGFFLGNVGEHVCDTLKQRGKDKAGIPVESVAQVVNQIEKRMEAIAKNEVEVQNRVETLSKVAQSNVEATNAILNVLKAGR